VVAVKLADPHFEAQTKVRLTNPEVGSFVETTVNKAESHIEDITAYIESEINLDKYIDTELTLRSIIK